MKEWYKYCPYCDNEIKEQAIKCQYCWEFLNKNSSSDGNKPRYANMRIWIVILVVAIISIFVYNSDWWKQVRIDYMFDKMEKNIQNAKSYDEIKEDLNNIKTTTPEEEAAFEELWQLMDNFYGKISTISESDLFLDPNNYKDEGKINQTIRSWDLYAEYFNWYSSDVKDFLASHKSLDNTWNWKYSLKWMSNEIEKLANSLQTYANRSTDFYKYLLNIQDDFYVETDWQVYFYEEWNEMTKYNQLYTALYEGSIKYVEDYNNYTNYLDKYDKYWNM